MIDEEILDLFREESEEHLSALETSLLDLESADDLGSRRGIIDNVFRHAHSIKGSARAVGLDEIQDCGQILEDTLDELRENPEGATKETIEQALSQFDALRAAYRRWESGDEGDATNLNASDITDQNVAAANPNDLSESPTSKPVVSDAEADSCFVDDEILALFREESQEHVAALETLLLDLEATDDPAQRRTIIDNVFRHAHTIKGSARVIGLMKLQDLAQVLEDTLDEMREAPENVTPEVIETALAQFDAVQQAYHAWSSEEKPINEAVGEGSAEKEVSPTTVSPTTDVTDTKQAKPAATPTGPKPSRSGKTTEERFVVRVPAERLDRMLSLAGEVRVSQRGSNTLENQLSVIGEVVAQTLADCKRYDEKRALLTLADRSQSFKDPVDQLQTQLEGAVERLRQLQSDFGKKRFREELLVEELEQDIRTARLVPLSNLTDSLRRAVRDLVQSLDKSIRYQPDVGNILLDKAVMESLKDPLMHMIRNAADHGIEMPAARVAAGKSEEGTITITASRRAESVLVRISDDGGGINFDRIRQKLKEENGLDDAEIASQSEKELARFLFQAGFSTKQEATAVSGRGVGMDVVVDAIHRLQGTVELESSSPETGTTFLITVPVTISTARILTVNSGGQRYGIPTTAMVYTGRLKANSLREIEGCPILTVDGQPVRWVQLTDLLGAPSRAVPANDDWRAYLLLMHEGRRLALSVEEFEDESEVILKSLEFPLTEMDEVIGGTIRPDGSVQLVLDPAWLMSKALQNSKRAAPTESKPSAQILVVDDSPTTRSIVRNVLAASGYAVQTAADGVEALERLRTRPFDLVVSDVEMPRMNGFELTRQVKSRFGLPVILVTGLEKEEDRLQGMQAGADAYVVKSTFEDKSLLEIVQQFV